MVFQRGFISMTEERMHAGKSKEMAASSRLEMFDLLLDCIQAIQRIELVVFGLVE